MAITSYISLISLLILFMCQINLSVALDLSQYRYHSYPLRQQDGRLILLNEYFRQHYPFDQQQKSSYNPTILSDNTIDQEALFRSNWFKRDLRLNNQANKRMLCFFHAVNCFG